jgi:pyridoxamine 5'-phosphate oxidase
VTSCKRGKPGVSPASARGKALSQSAPVTPQPLLSPSATCVDTAATRSGLVDIEHAVWRELMQACRNREHAWRSACLATVDADGLPDARTVVLREADPDGRHLAFFTDARSPKVAQMQQRPEGVLVLWSAALGWQLRIKVALVVHTSGLAVSSRWAQLKMTPAAHDYLSPLAPGSTLAQRPIERESRDYFAMVRAQVRQIDWLELAPTAHRRALFPTGEPARWVQP